MPTEDQVMAGARAMVMLGQKFRQQGLELPSRRAEARACLEAALAVPAWSTDFTNAPSEPYEFFLVRPKGRHLSRGRVFHPSIVQRIDGKFYTSTNEFEPLYFGQDEADDHPLKTTLEWRHFPADWLVPSEEAT